MGITEIFVIMVIGLIVIGPEKLPDIAKTIGKTIAEFKKVVDGVKTSINEEKKDIQSDLGAPATGKSLKEKSEELIKEYAGLSEDNEKKKEV